MACKNNRLVIKIKSGEAKDYGITVKVKSGIDESGNLVYKPLNLTEYTVDFEIKLYPYFSVEPIIYKHITTLEDGSVGWITDPLNGKFKVQITLEDMQKLIPNKDYYLIVTLLNGEDRIIISGEGDTSGIFRVCQS